MATSTSFFAGSAMMMILGKRYDMTFNTVESVRRLQHDTHMCTEHNKLKSHSLNL